MKNPEILLLPIMMFSDYFLTVFGAIQKEIKYDDHFKAQHYELNPIWQKQISQKKWFNPRHILLTVLVSGVLAGLIEFGNIPAFVVQGLLGCVFVLFGMIIGRHLSNIMVFRYLVKKPDDISGQITMAHSLILSISTYQYLVGVIPIAIIAVFTPTPFALGGLGGAILILAVHVRWIQKYKSQIKASTKADAGDSK
jgi:hypothetical protein